MTKLEKSRSVADKEIKKLSAATIDGLAHMVAYRATCAVADNGDEAMDVELKAYYAQVVLGLERDVMAKACDVLIGMAKGGES